MRDESAADKTTINSLENSATECQKQLSDLGKEIQELKSKSESDHETESTENAALKANEAKLMAEIEDNKDKYHTAANELYELKDALAKMGIEVGEVQLCWRCSWRHRNFSSKILLVEKLFR